MIDVYEKFEKHETLNPKLFDKSNHLLPDVKEALLGIVNKFLESLADDDIKINVRDIKIVGSNCSYNYTDKSDIDLHIETDTNSLECPDNLYPLIYSAYRSIFNSKYDFKVKGIPVEIFVETSDTEQMSEKLAKNYYRFEIYESIIDKLSWTLVKETSSGEYFWDGSEFTIPFEDRDKASYQFNSAQEARNFINKKWPWEVRKNSSAVITPYLKGKVKIDNVEVPETEYHIVEARQQTALRSNGIYSIMNDTWVKEPVPEDIPELDNDKFEALYSEWEDKYFDTLEQNNADAIDDFIEDLYDLRKTSISEEGEYGYGNQVFKEMRNLGYLDNLKEVKNQLISKELSLESLQEDTIKVKDHKWINKGAAGTHGTFKTKKEADAQRKAMFAQGYQKQ